MPAWLIPAIMAAASIASKAFEKKPGSQKFHTLSSEQRQLQSRIMQMLQGSQGFGEGSPFQAGQGYMKDIFSQDPQAMKAFEAPYMRQFQEQTVPGLAERFAGMGAGAQSSSGFQQALGQAGAGLSEQLAALRGELQMRALPYSFQGMNQLLPYAFQSNFARGLNPREPGAASELLAPIIQGMGSGYGQQFGQSMYSGRRRNIREPTGVDPYGDEYEGAYQNMQRQYGY